MKKLISILLALLLCLAFISPSLAEEELGLDEAMYGEFPEDESLQEEPLSDIIDEEAIEFVPELEDSDELFEEQMQYIPAFGSLPDDFSVPYYSGGMFMRNSSEPLPASYDLRDYNCITPIRNQGSYSTCWAFSVMAAAESNILKNYAVPTDLSELQLAWFYFNGTLKPDGTYNDPLNNFGGDHGYTEDFRHSFERNGGSPGRALMAQSAWIGVMPEEGATEYSSSNINSLYEHGLDYSYAFDRDSFHLTNVRTAYINDLSCIKKLILNYGAVSCSYLHSEANMSENSAYYMDAGSSGGTGHSVAIIGWDDNYSKENFNEDCRPTFDGAWLIRNSWGEYSGLDGYFWMSYESNHGSGRTNVYAAAYEPAGNYDFCYQYDGGLLLSGSGYRSNVIYTANVFTAQHNELIKAVSFWHSYQSDSPYTLYIVKNPAEGRPMSGEILYSSSGTTSQNGYYTIPLSTPIALERGDSFAVVIMYQNFRGDAFYFDVDGSFDSPYHGSKAIASAGQSYVFPRSAELDASQYNLAWTDFGSSNQKNLRIKAFTVETTDRSISEADITFSQDYYITNGEAVNAEAVVKYYGTVLEKGKDYAVSYIGNTQAGMAQAVFTGKGLYSGIAVRQFRIKMPGQISASISNDLIKLERSALVSAQYNGDGELTFVSEDPEVAVVDEYGNVTGKAVGTTAISVSAGEGEVYSAASCTVSVTVTDHYAGDVNDDDIVNTKDFITLMKLLAGFDVTYNPYAIDINADGKTNTYDFVLLMKYVVDNSIVIH